MVMICLYIYLFKGKNGGAITFGGHDDKYVFNKKSSFKFSPVMDENYWVVEVVGIRKVYVKDGKEKWVNQNMCSIGCKAILDTGSYFIYGPKQYIAKINADIQIKDCLQIKDLPHIVVVLVAHPQNGKKHVLKLRFAP